MPLRITLLIAALAVSSAAQVAVRGDTVYTMAGETLKNAVVIVEDGKIKTIGPAMQTPVPQGYRVLAAKVVTPGLIDARSAIGLTGYLNQEGDQEQFERSAAMQPELRAVDAYNPHEVLVEWARSYGVTTIHTGHAPGVLISGQTMVVKTRGNTVEEALVKPLAMVAATIGTSARGRNNKSPGTRGKMVSMLREEFLKAQQYADKQASAEDNKQPDRNLRSEVLAKVLAGEVPLLVTAQRLRDIQTALRIADEFGFQLVLDGAAESYELIDQIKEAGVPVIVHPTMARAFGDMENMSFETAAKLKGAGIPIALQSSYESYVPKSRLVLFEAGIAAANGLSFEDALGAITIDAAKILGVDDRVGSIEVGKDADFALYDGDPFEYATHCVGTVIEGEIVSEAVR